MNSKTTKDIFEIAVIDVNASNCTCYFYDGRLRQYFDGMYMGDYSIGDIVEVEWEQADEYTREAVNVTKIR